MTLKVRSPEFAETSRAARLAVPTNDLRDVLSALRRLARPSFEAAGGRVRLVGVSLHDLVDEVQPRLSLGGDGTVLLGRSPQAGSRVMHRVFGPGTVVVGGAETAVVRFDDGGVRILEDPRTHLIHFEDT